MQNIINFIKIYPILSFLWFFLLFIILISFFKKIFSKAKLINCHETIYQINKKNAILVDLRSPENYQKGHILGSINLTIEQVKKNNILHLKKYKECPLILICENGNVTQNISNKFINLGFNKVLILKSGIVGWINENLPIYF